MKPLPQTQRADPDKTRAAGPAGDAPRSVRATPFSLISEAFHALTRP